MAFLIFQSSLFILVVFILRWLLKNRIRRLFFLIAWAFVFIKMISPFGISSPFSIYNLENKGSANLRATIQSTQLKMPEHPAILQNSQGHEVVGQNSIQYNLLSSNPVALEIKTFGRLRLMDMLWKIGSVALFIFFILGYITEARRIGKSLQPIACESFETVIQSRPLRRKPKLYASNKVFTPITYGLFRPKIVLPHNLGVHNEIMMEHILLHELSHIRRFDILLKILGVLGVCVQWFNPLVWLSYKTLCLDIEINCDEAVIGSLGETKKSEYAMSLIGMAEYKKNFCPSIISTFGQRPIKERVLNIMSYKKTKVATSFLSAIILAGSISVFGTAATNDHPVASSANETMDSKTLYHMIMGSTDTTSPNVNIKKLQGLTFENIAHYKLNQGDVIEVSGFAYDKNKHFSLAINDDRCTNTQKIYEFVNDSVSDFNGSYVATETGDYYIWLGNKDEIPHENITGKITILRDTNQIIKPVVMQKVKDTHETYKQFMKNYTEAVNNNQETSEGDEMMATQLIGSSRIGWLNGWVDKKEIKIVNGYGLSGKSGIIERNAPSGMPITYYVYLQDVYEHPYIYNSGYTYRAYLESGYYLIQTSSPNYVVVVTNKTTEKNLIPTSSESIQEINGRALVALCKNFAIVQPFWSNQVVLTDPGFNGEDLKKFTSQITPAYIKQKLTEEFEISNFEGITIMTTAEFFKKY